MPERPAETNPWDRREGESSPAFAAFRRYLESGPGRSLRAVTEATGKPRSLVAEWSSRWSWVDRARAYDGHLAAAEDAARARAAAEAGAGWERRRMESLERTHQLCERVYDRALRMLDWPLSTKSLDGGKTVVAPAKWTMGTAAALVKTYAELSMFVVAEALSDDDEFDPLSATPEENAAYIERMKARRSAVRSAAGSA